MNFSNDLPRAWFKGANSCASTPIFFILLLSILLLVSCKTTRSTISLDEAKQVSLQFSDTSFVPPPRSIDDLRTKISPYTGLTSTVCTTEPFLSLDQIEQRLKYAPPYPAEGCGARILMGLAKIELNLGNYSRSIDFLEGAIKELPHDAPSGAIGNRLTTLAKHYAYAGDFDSANKTFKKANRMYSRQGSRPIRDRDSSVRFFHYSSRAIIEQLRGNYKQAESYFRKAITATVGFAKEFRPIDERKYLLEADLAENLMLQGRLLEAEIYARNLANFDEHYPGSRNSYARGKVLLVLAKILFKQGRYEDSEYMAKAAVNAYLFSGTNCSSVFLNVSRKILAQSLMAQERWDEALSQFEAIRQGMESDPDAFDARFGGDVDWALTLLSVGRIDEAAAMLDKGLERSKRHFGEKHYRTAEIMGLTAMTLAEDGKQEQALKVFMNAMPILQAMTFHYDDEALTKSAQNQRFVHITEGYLSVLDSIKGTDVEKKAGIDVGAVAFHLAELIREQSVQRAVEANCARVAAKDPGLADLVRREQDAQKQINAMYGALANATSQRIADQNQEVIQSIRMKIDMLTNARMALREEINNSFPDFAKLINPKPPKLKDVQTDLLLDEVIFSIYIGRHRSYIWVIPYKRDIVFASVPLGRGEVKDMVDRVRYALEPNAKTLGGIPEFDLDTAYAIYHAFLHPVREGWKDAKNLLVVPHEALGYLPFSLLPTKPSKLAADKEIFLSNYQKVPWLVRSHSVTVLPSVASLVTLRALPPNNPNRLNFVGFGDPYFSEQQAKAASIQKEKVKVASKKNLHDYVLRGIKIERIKTEQLDSAELALLPRLPETADEIRSIALALNADLTKGVFTGVQANEHQVKAIDISAYKVVAFATHGLAPGDLNGLLQPALALSSPKVAGIKGDGLLTMGEILALRLNADWVILSACNTGAGKEEGAGALSGLGRAFFYAGARALLVSNWPVETTSAKALTTDLFKRQAENPKMTRAEALRQSMQSLIDGTGYTDPEMGDVIFSYAHPIFWAPFTVVGAGD